jgi:hypothetical protein
MFFFINNFDFGSRTRFRFQNQIQFLNPSSASSVGWREVLKDFLLGWRPNEKETRALECEWDKKGDDWLWPFS